MRGYVAENMVPHPDIDRPKTTAPDGNTLQPPQQKSGQPTRETTEDNENTSQPKKSTILPNGKKPNEHKVHQRRN
jgi:hypothetical protein